MAKTTNSLIMKQSCKVLVLIVLSYQATCKPSSQSDDFKYQQMQQQMLVQIKQDTRVTHIATGISELSPKVIKAMTDVKRHLFVPEQFDEYSYHNRPLPIGSGQTISQPFIVALMTELLAIENHHKVLEVGTGSGYQAAILAKFSDRVFSIEIIEELGVSAAKRLKSLEYNNVKVKVADGYKGWPDEAPFDAIIVTAAALEIPPPLIAQLKAGGRMVIPVGGQNQVQQLKLVAKDDTGKVTIKDILAVRFVPLTGERKVD